MRRTDSPVRKSIVALALLAASAWLLAPMPARAAQSYGTCTAFVTSVPAVIGTPGHWCLDRKLATASTSGIAIYINADDVTLDCNDFTLDGSAAGDGTQAFGIYAKDRNNAIVRHCHVRGFYFGITLAGGSRHLVEDNRLDDNTFVAVRVDGIDATVRGNLVQDTGGSTAYPAAFGIFVNSPSSDVLGNTVNGVYATTGLNGSAYGIYTAGNLDGSITGNRVGRLVKDGAGNAYGIFNNGSDRIVIRRNDLLGVHPLISSGLGLRCSDGHGSARDNTITGFAAGIAGCSNDGGNVNMP